MANVNTITVFECPRVRFERDDENGCLTLWLGTVCIHVYGEDPYKACPELIEGKASFREHLEELRRREAVDE